MNGGVVGRSGMPVGFWGVEMEMEGEEEEGPAMFPKVVGRGWLEMEMPGVGVEVVVVVGMGWEDAGWEDAGWVEVVMGFAEAG